MTRKFLLALIILIAASAQSVFAQNPQELRVGSSVSGNLGSGQEIWYSVRAAERGFLTVKTTGDVDTYLEVYDAQRNYITENDDGDDLNALVNVAVQANTVYLFKLRGYDAYHTGAYQIHASFRSMQSIAELRTGARTNGNISYGDKIMYSFRASQSGQLTVETSGSTDTYITLYDENLHYLNYDDDSAGGINDRITWPVTSGRTFYIEVGAYSSGPFGITASIAPFPQLNIGSSQNGNVTEGQYIYYIITANRSGALTVETSGQTDTNLELLDDHFEYLTYDDDGAGFPNDRLTWSVISGRTYYIKVGAYGTGPFGISARIQ